MATTSLPSISLEYVKTRIRLFQSGAEVDPTGNTVEFAFISTDADESEPEATDWVAGSWETQDDRYYARVLVGPSGTITLTDGTYHTWVRVDTGTEIPARNTGRLVVT